MSTFFTRVMSEKAETKKKKNGAHTHVCTTVQLDERNIHVGCCLFSHDTATKKLIATTEFCNEALD